MAKKVGTKSAKSKASGILGSIFGGKTTKSCSSAGSKLASDSTKKKAKSKAGSKLGSMSCKAPARRSKV